MTQFAQNKLSQFLVQNGKKFVIPGPTDTSISSTSDITPDFCSKVFTTFDDRNRFEEVGGWKNLNAALDIPMVLVMSIWDDVSVSNIRSSLRSDELTCFTALRQHALARLHLPTREGGPARRRSWSLRSGLRYSQRGRVSVRQLVSFPPPKTKTDRK